jgi:hypothetical protein
MDEINPYAPPKASLVPESALDNLAPYLTGLVHPLSLTFRVLTFAPRIDVVDATGRPVVHARQKLFKFKEHVEVFSDATRTTKLADIRANKVMDWTARYTFTDAWGGEIGSVGRKGWRSLWRAHYEVFNPGDQTHDFTIREENPFAKMVDGIIGQIPVLGIITSWLFHPRYLATRADGSDAMRLQKRPALLQGKFSIQQTGENTPRETMNLILSLLMLTLLERQRG